MKLNLKLNQKLTETKEQSVMVGDEGIEPPTHSLEGCCSIQLSYRTIEPPIGIEPMTY